MGTRPNSSSEKSYERSACAQYNKQIMSARGDSAGRSKERRNDLLHTDASSDSQKKSSVIFTRSTSRCCSLPQLIESDSKVDNITDFGTGSRNKSHLEHGNNSYIGERTVSARLPQSLRQTFAQPSNVPLLATETSPGHRFPPTGSSDYHKLTSYTGRHLPNPTTEVL